MDINIRDFYTPIQPVIRQKDKLVTYQEIAPNLNLSPFIYCYWQLQSTISLKEAFHYRAVADGCVDLFFELDKPSSSYVMGFCKKYTEFPLANTFNYVGIRFLPTMFPQLFNINASELSNRFEQLDQVIPSTAAFIKESFTTNDQLQMIKDKFDAYFSSLMTNLSFNADPRLYQAIAFILQKQGVLAIEKELSTGISQRQLRRLFEFYIGDTAKTFSKVVRFQNILKAKPSLQSLRQNKLFFDQGFYDQAHFIKDFKNFYGLTPTSAFNK